MKKSELISLIAEKSGLSKTDAEKVFSATFEVIAENLAQQKKVMVHGFGGFATKERKARKGRNPSTGEEITIPEATIAIFKPATQLKETINN